MTLLLLTCWGENELNVELIVVVDGTNRDEKSMPCDGGLDGVDDVDVVDDVDGSCGSGRLNDWLSCCGGLVAVVDIDDDDGIIKGC